MPFYSCAFRSLPPASDALALAEDEDFGSRSSLLLLSRLIRENACTWLSSNLKPIVEGIKAQRAKRGNEFKVSIESWRLMPHLRVAFSLLVELAASSDLADESILNMKLFDHVLEQFWICLNALDDEKEKAKAVLMNGWAWEIVQIIRERDRPTFGSRACSPMVWLLWGQALIKISRNYLIPKQSLGETLSSVQHHRALYNHCLDLAATKFEKCSRLVIQLSKIQRSAKGSAAQEAAKVLERTCSECYAALGHIMLSKARDCSEEDPVLKKRLLGEAQTLLRRAYSMDSDSTCVYNLACVASLSDRPIECQSYLHTAYKKKILPPLIHVFHDPDLDPMRSQDWFPSFLQAVPNEKPSADNSWMYSLHIGMTLLDSTFAMPEPTLNMVSQPKAALHIPKPRQDQHYTPPHSTSPSNPQQIKPNVPNKTGNNAAAAPGADASGDGLTESMIFDEGLNKLQASLTRDGFSRSTVVGMLKEVHKQKKAEKAQHERFEAAHARLMTRLEAAGMKQKSVIPGDGNCQFHSISDQLFDNLEQSAWVRAQVVAWLRAHGDWELPENGARLKDFAMEDWDSYCANMSRPGIWGDHMTLTAASHLFGVRIVLFSSIEDNHYVTEYVPSVITSPKVLYLCHYAEYHYGSVCHKDPEEIEKDRLAAEKVLAVAKETQENLQANKAQLSIESTASSAPMAIPDSNPEYAQQPPIAPSAAPSTSPQKH